MNNLFQSAFASIRKGKIEDSSLRNDPCKIEQSFDYSARMQANEWQSQDIEFNSVFGYEGCQDIESFIVIPSPWQIE